MHLPSSVLPAGPRPVASTRLIDYGGIVEQAIRDVIDWVEHDEDPPADTSFTTTANGGIELAGDAVERGGVQPVVRLTASGAARAEVRVGERVQLEARVELPPGAGGIVKLEWDLDGAGRWPVSEDGLDGALTALTATRGASYAEPGTYFPSVRVTAHRDGDVDATFGRLVNLGRARVVVTSA
jgi:hypothetical protein